MDNSEALYMVGSPISRYAPDRDIYDLERAKQTAMTFSSGSPYYYGVYRYVNRYELDEKIQNEDDYAGYVLIAVGVDGKLFLLAEDES